MTRAPSSPITSASPTLYHVPCYAVCCCVALRSSSRGRKGKGKVRSPSPGDREVARSLSRSISRDRRIRCLAYCCTGAIAPSVRRVGLVFRREATSSGFVLCGLLGVVITKPWCSVRGEQICCTYAIVWILVVFLIVCPPISLGSRSRWGLLFNCRWQSSVLCCLCRAFRVQSCADVVGCLILYLYVFSWWAGCRRDSQSLSPSYRRSRSRSRSRDRAVSGCVNILTGGGEGRGVVLVSLGG